LGEGIDLEQALLCDCCTPSIKPVDFGRECATAPARGHLLAAQVSWHPIPTFVRKPAFGEEKLVC
jgi:hypothetical protein